MFLAADSTGKHSLYTRYQDYEIMFHVSTMLPYTANNTQQVKVSHSSDQLIIRRRLLLHIYVRSDCHALAKAFLLHNKHDIKILPPGVYAHPCCLAVIHSALSLFSVIYGDAVKTHTKIKGLHSQQTKGDVFYCIILF